MPDTEKSNGCSRAAKREACDKCHNIKTRCFKSNGSGVCNRCERFELVCTYSAPLRIGRPKGSGNGKSTLSDKGPAEEEGMEDTPVETREMEEEHTWTGVSEEFDFDMSTYLEPDPQQDMVFDTLMQWQPNLAPIDHQQMVVSDESSAGELATFVSSKARIDTTDHESADHESTPSPNRTTYKLMDLQLKLYNLSECFVVTWSQLPGHEEPLSQCAFSSSSISLDETFAATESLINVVHELCPPKPVSCDLSDGCLRYNPIKCGNTGLCDNPTMLLIMSCYLRILNIYEHLANTLSTDIKSPNHSAFTSPAHSTSSNSQSTSPAAAVPILNLGRFNLSSSPEMNIGLMVHFILEMIERLQTAVELCAFTARNNTTMAKESPRADMSSRNYQVPRGGDRISKLATSTVPAVEAVFDSTLSDLGTQEQGLIGSLHEIKYQLKKRSITRSGY